MHRRHPGAVLLDRQVLRRATTLAIPVFALTAAFLVASCENENWLLEVTFVNHTDADLRIYVSVEPVASVAAGRTVTTQIGGGMDCVSDARAVTEDGQMVAVPPEPLCQRDTWTIEQSDLEPVPSPGPGS